MEVTLVYIMNCFTEGVNWTQTSCALYIGENAGVCPSVSGRRQKHPAQTASPLQGSYSLTPVGNLQMQHVLRIVRKLEHPEETHASTGTCQQEGR